MPILATYGTLPLPFGKGLEVGNHRRGYSNKCSEARINSALLCIAHNRFALQHKLFCNFDIFYFTIRKFILA
jgi:hypothetical protein